MACTMSSTSQHHHRGRTMIPTLLNMAYPPNWPCQTSSQNDLQNDFICSRCKKTLEASSPNAISCYCCGQLCCSDCIAIDSGLLPGRDRPDEHVCKDCYHYNEKTGQGTWNSAAYEMARLAGADCTLLKSSEVTEAERRPCFLVMEKSLKRMRRPPSMTATRTFTRSS